MTDKELLEYAAKAAGIECIGPMGDDGMHLFNGKHWNPLTDDGDALRLAVNLNMGISIPVHRTIRADVVCFQDSSISAREEWGDPYTATRRAIVRAAAELGKAMK